MRRLAAVLLFTASCVAKGPLSAARDKAGPSVSAPLEATAPTPVKSFAKECPFSTKTKGTLPELFEPLPDLGEPVLSLRRVRANLATVSNFSRDGDDAALSLLVSVIERDTGFSIPFLKLLSGPVLAVPAEVGEPFVLKGSPAGLIYQLPWAGFWHEGKCEHLEGGPVRSLRGIGDGEVIGVRMRPGLGADVVIRRTDGSWWSMGALPEGTEPVATIADGRITLAWSRHDGFGLSSGAQFPDLGRTEIVRRYAKFQPRSLYGGVAPWPGAWGPSRFSAPMMLDYDWEKTGVMVLDRPAFRGFERSWVATVQQERGCERDFVSNDGPPNTKRRSVSKPTLLTLGKARALVFWVEDEVRCRYVQSTPERDTCVDCPRQERHAEDIPVRTSRTMELVVTGMDDRPRELARIRLPVTPEEHSVGGVSVTTWRGRVMVFANGYLVELDRAALEAAW